MIEVCLVAILSVLGLPAVLSAVYLAVATVLSARPEPPTRSSGSLRFDVIIPAHNEAALIARCIASLQRLDWPTDRFRVIVVADNCDDSTAQIAREAGAGVLVRKDQTLRGKGYALRHAFEASARQQWADALVVVDADSVVSGNLLEAFAARIEHGAHAVQAHYGILNPVDSWRTRLMAIAQAAFHIIRSRARERLCLSCGIRGNGWCVTPWLLLQVPYRAFSVVEDVEYGIDLGLVGQRVHYADEASVSGQAESTGAMAQGQRQRWEGGRVALLRSRVLGLLSAFIRYRNRLCLDLALDLLVPPLSSIALNVAAFGLVASIAHWRDPGLVVPLWTATACAGVLVLYVLRAWHLSGTGIRGMMDLARVPVFVVWKLVVMRGRHSGEWVRTQRQRP